MESKKIITLMELYGECPRCGNQYLGEGNGTLSIEENSFVRTCECGFSVSITEKWENADKRQDCVNRFKNKF